MVLEQLTQKLDAVLDLQAKAPIAVLAYRLDAQDANTIRIALDPDVPDMGALGRWKGLPVFAEQHALPEMPEEAIEGELDGIRYIYLEFVVT